MSVAHLALRKYLTLRKKYGHDYANKKLTEQEHYALDRLIISSCTPQNYDPKTGGFIIREDT